MNLSVASEFTYIGIFKNKLATKVAFSMVKVNETGHMLKNDDYSLSQSVPRCCSDSGGMSEGG